MPTSRTTSVLCGLAAAALVAALATACGSPKNNVIAEAAALEGQGKLDEAAAKLEMGCALSPAAEPCPASDRQASETWQRAAEKAVSEGRYRDAERRFIRALITADEASRAKITERLGKDDLVQGLRYERAVMLPDKAAAAGLLAEVAKTATPAAEKAKTWLANEQPGLLIAAVMAACGPAREGSCSKAWEALQAAALTGPEADKAREVFEAEERRVYPYRVQVEGFLMVFAGRRREAQGVEKCMNDQAGASESYWCSQPTTGMALVDKYEIERNEAALLRRALVQIGDPALLSAIAERRRSAEMEGIYVKQDIPKKKPAPKKKP